MKSLLLPWTSSFLIPMVPCDHHKCLSKHLEWMTCLPPLGQFDVGVLGQIWDAVRNDEASLVEGWKRKIRWLRFACWLCFTKNTLTDCTVNTETIHGPVLKCDRPQSQVGHKTLYSKDTRWEESRSLILWSSSHLHQELPNSFVRAKLHKAAKLNNKAKP